MQLSALFQQQQAMLGSELFNTGGASPTVAEEEEEEESSSVSTEPPCCYFDPEFKPKRPLSAYNFFL